MKIFIWGTGDMTQKYLEMGEVELGDIYGFIETKKTKETFKNINVYEPSELIDKEYDYILVCVIKYSEEIYRTAKHLNLDVDKMIFIDNWRWCDGTEIWKDHPQTVGKKICNEQDDELVSRLFPKLWDNFMADTVKYLKRHIVVLKNGSDLVETEQVLNSIQDEDIMYRKDYTRYRTFELMANEIINRKVEGAVAELGVFQGVFSKLVNGKFKDKKMYLFDTFESFDVGEFQDELNKGRCESDFREAFLNTSVSMVMDKMLYPDQIEVRKGFFPDSLNGMKEETYCFVSIDVDFEKSILEGLRYFYPRLNEGGAIFLHDYNNYFLEGVRMAVDTYETEIGHSLIKVPIADEGGTLIICK